MAKAPKQNVEQIETKPQDVGNRTKLKVTDLHVLQPKTLGQETFIELYNRGTDIIVQTGCAGTGKSTTALYAALSQVLDESNHYTKVIYVKPCVEERSRGFAPGTLDEKDAQFEISVQQTVDSLLKVRNGYAVAKAFRYIQFWTTGLRGLTFNDAVVILDEGQNYDYREIKTLIERVGEGSRLIIMGDERQEDLSRHREKSGLSKALEVCSRMEGVTTGIVHYMPEDNVRGGISRAFCIADYYHGGE